MANIMELKKKFDDLPITLDTIPLYEGLLSLDRSDFVALMEAMLEGRIDIEDIRPLFNLTIQFETLSQKPLSATFSESLLKDPRIEIDQADFLKENIVRRFEGREDEVVKESFAYPSTGDLKLMIANQFKESTGMELTPEDVDSLLPIVETEMVLELSLYNANAVKSKDYQLLISDLLSYKPMAEL